jgi:hypothetical protein
MKRTRSSLVGGMLAGIVVLVFACGGTGRYLSGGGGACVDCTGHCCTEDFDFTICCPDTNCSYLTGCIDGALPEASTPGGDGGGGGSGGDDGGGGGGGGGGGSPPPPPPPEDDF